ncbi:MAG: hypothetical protein J6Q83_04600 [Clostridia bacterium]|nr:hypothetical protein [Clostridia bacterium]
MSERDLELQKENSDIEGDNPELEEKAAKKFSGEKSYKKSELDQELELLAQTFRDELKKAQEAHGEEYFEDDEGIISEDELCECCGECRRDKSFGADYPYCADCREAMSRYPISWINVVVSLALVVLSIVSCVTFFGDFGGYFYSYVAKKSVSERRMTTAIEAYDTAISVFDAEEINAKKLRLECADAVYETMNEGISSMDKVSDLVTDALSELETKLPLNQSYVELRDEVMVLYGTMQKFYLVVNDEQYANFENKAVYESAMTAIGQILDEQIQVKSMYGDKLKSYPADEAMVRFCQFMFAYTAGYHEDSYQYMRKVQELKPDYLWLYAYELGLVEAQTGDVKAAKELAQAMYENDVENYGSYCIYACAERLSGNIEKSISWADKGINNVPESSEIRRHKAMALALKGDLEESKAVLEEANQIEQNGLISITMLVVENELGNTDRVEELKTYLESNEVELPQRTQDYLSGKLTLQNLFGEGTGDIE